MATPEEIQAKIDIQRSQQALKEQQYADRRADIQRATAERAAERAQRNAERGAKEHDANIARDLKNLGRGLQVLPAIPRAFGATVDGLGNLVGAVTGFEGTRQAADGVRGARGYHAQTAEEIARQRYEAVTSGGYGYPTAQPTRRLRVQGDESGPEFRQPYDQPYAPAATAHNSRPARERVMSPNEAVTQGITAAMQEQDPARRGEIIQNISGYVATNPKTHTSKVNPATGQVEHTFAAAGARANSPEELVATISANIARRDGSLPPISREELGLPPKPVPQQRQLRVDGDELRPVQRHTIGTVTPDREPVAPARPRPVVLGHEATAAVAPPLAHHVHANDGQAHSQADLVVQPQPQVVVEPAAGPVPVALRHVPATPAPASIETVSAPQPLAAPVAASAPAAVAIPAATGEDAQSYSGIKKDDMPKGLKQNQVDDVQNALIKAGFSVGSHGADNKWGKDSQAGLIAAAKAAGIDDYKKIDFSNPNDPEFKQLMTHLASKTPARSTISVQAPAFAPWDEDLPFTTQAPATTAPAVVAVPVVEAPVPTAVAAPVVETPVPAAVTAPVIEAPVPAAVTAPVVEAPVPTAVTVPVVEAPVPAANVTTSTNNAALNTVQQSLESQGNRDLSAAMQTLQVVAVSPSAEPAPFSPPVGAFASLQFGFGGAEATTAQAAMPAINLSANAHTDALGAVAAIRNLQVTNADLGAPSSAGNKPRDTAHGVVV